MKKLFIWTFVVGVVLGAAVMAWGYISFKGNAALESKEFYVSRNTTYDELIDSLKPSIKHHLAFDIYAERLGLSESYKKGHYVVKDGMNVIEIVRMFKLGLQTPVKVTMNNVKIPAQLAGKLSNQIAADSATLLSAMRNKQLRKELGFVKDSTIAMFIPNTYEVYWDITPEKLLHRIKREYDRFWSAERIAKLERCKLSKYEVITLASIVYEETKVKDEMARISGVYINRLRKNMRLQADPTVKYAMGDFTIKRVLRKHLKFDSPFNTYTNAGLPPAPICIPSIAAIDAVLDYEEHDYLYFCARPEFDGRHNFAITLDEHNVNARKFADALNKRGIK